jgi:hypothetical protein
MVFSPVRKKARTARLSGCNTNLKNYFEVP